MKKVRGILGVILSVCITVVMLTGCGESAELLGCEGTYQSVSGEMMGVSVDFTDFVLELKAGGKGKLTVNDDSGSCKWSLDGDQITVTVQGEEMVGTLSGDKIRFDDMMGMGMAINFEKDNSAE